MTRFFRPAARSCSCYSAQGPSLGATRPALRTVVQLPPASARFAASAAAPKAKRKGKDRWPGWKPTIGIELHVQLKGNVKLFSRALAHYDAQPNSHVALMDAALPGALPILQPEPVRLALLACLAFKSSINRASTFDRKHYFYPDLPAGYQVTQKYSPLAKGGVIRIRQDAEKGETRFLDVRLDQVQLEQDTAKSFHDPDSNGTLVDLNRAGAALIEIVTQPDMSSPEEAAAFVRTLQAILRHVGASGANMERGELRCDVNVSVQRASPDSPPGTRCEVKNLNGVRFVMGAIESEISRQIADLEAGKPIEQATRGYDAVQNRTFHLRGKEDAPDYRYMPDPELGRVVVTEQQLDILRASLPELPDAAFERLQAQYGLSARDAGILVALGEGLEEDPTHDGEEGTASVGVTFFEEVARGREAKMAANWVIHDLLGQLTKANLNLVSSPIKPRDLGALIDAISSGKLTGTHAKSLLRTFLSAPPSPASSSSFTSLVSAAVSSARASSSIDALSPLLDAVLSDLSVEAEKVRQGHHKVLMRLVGEVMKRSQGQADAKRVTEDLKKRLGVPP
ncbi:hypothetical protein JCM1841_003559 [Sporobolomyces salmonicolor]